MIFDDFCCPRCWIYQSLVAILSVDHHMDPRRRASWKNHKISRYIRSQTDIFTPKIPTSPVKSCKIKVKIYDIAQISLVSPWISFWWLRCAISFVFEGGNGRLQPICANWMYQFGLPRSKDVKALRIKRVTNIFLKSPNMLICFLKMPIKQDTIDAQK